MQKAETNPGLSRDTRKPMEIVDCRRYACKLGQGMTTSKSAFISIYAAPQKKKEKKERTIFTHMRAHTQPTLTVISTLTKYTHKINNPSYNMCKSTNDTGMHLRGIYTKYSSYA